jgi:hypothetical protein
MPPDGRLDDQQIALLERWIEGGAPGPESDLGHTEFSRLGDQGYLFEQAASHWAFQPVVAQQVPGSMVDGGVAAVDYFVAERLQAVGLTMSAQADARTIIRRLSYDLTGLPPKHHDVQRFCEAYSENQEAAVLRVVEQLLLAPEYGEHLGRMWLDVVRYADTDDFYRPDTRTPHYFPFAFTYRDYVVSALNADKPFDQFIKEQLAADQMGIAPNSPEMAALGFLAVGPHANRSPEESLDEWIDITSRGLMGISAACARCHDHKYEPVPTTDYYSLRVLFDGVNRIHPLDEKHLPEISGYAPRAADVADYETKRREIDEKISAAAGTTTGGNNRPVPLKIKETELAELLLFHPGAPARAMVVQDKPQVPAGFVFVRGEPAVRGEPVAPRFLSVLDPEKNVFKNGVSPRLQLAERIASPDNPLTARVFVNRVWGYLMGSYLVSTPSDFGLQGESPSHPELLDWLTRDFISHQWSVKHLVRTIVTSRTYQQESSDRALAVGIDPENKLLWRANRKRLSIEQMRDSMLDVANSLDRTPRGRAGQLWGPDYSRRRAIYGYINRFNIDPTLRAFDFPPSMQSHPAREESIVAQQALFALNSPFVIEQASAMVRDNSFCSLESDRQRAEWLFHNIYQREPEFVELDRVERFVQQMSTLDGKSPSKRSAWELVAQSLLMSNEFQYVD